MRTEGNALTAACLLALCLPVSLIAQQPPPAERPTGLPGQPSRSPDDFELFLEGLLEAPRGPRATFAPHRYVPARGAPCCGAVPGAKVDDGEKIQGTWTVLSLEHRGVKLTQKDVPGAHFEFNKGECKIKLAALPEKYTFSIDPAAEPKAITVNLAPGQPVQGIYRFSDGRLLLCFPEKPRQTRPTEFTSKPGSDHRLFTLERAPDKCPGGDCRCAPCTPLLVTPATQWAVPPSSLPGPSPSSRP